MEKKKRVDGISLAIVILNIAIVAVLILLVVLIYLYMTGKLEPTDVANMDRGDNRDCRAHDRTYGSDHNRARGNGRAGRDRRNGIFCR